MLGVPGALASATSESSELAFSGGVVLPIAVILSAFIIRGRTGVVLNSKDKIKYFYPFSRDVTGGGAELHLVDHEARLATLKDCIEEKPGCLLVVGDSGAGKSTLVNALKNEKSIKVIKPRKSFALLVEDMEKFQSGDLSVLAIDQFERVRASLDTANSEDIKKFNAIISSAEVDKKSYLFVVRSDLLGPILDLLSQHRPTIHMVPGLHFEAGSQTVNATLARLEDLRLSAQELAVVKKQLTDAKSVNSFAFQVGGYLIESLSGRERRKHFNPIRFNEDSIAIYLDLVFAEYADVHLYARYLIHIETVLYTIASYNRKHDQGITVEQISHFTHMPNEYVERAVKFLKDRGVVEPDAEGRAAYFVAHDLIASEVLDSQPRHMQQDYRVAISELCSDQNDTFEMEAPFVEINPFKRAILGHVEGPFSISLSLLFIWAAALLYGLRLKSFDPVNSFSVYIPSWVLEFGGDVDIKSATYMFFPITFTLYMWILFMYGLDRGYFFYLHRRQAISGWAYAMVYVAGPIGIIIGFVSSFAPAIFPLGVVVPGLFIAIAYCNAALRDGNKKSLHHKYTFTFSWQIVLNMLISVFAVYLVSRVLRENSFDDSQWESRAIIFGIAILFSAFAYAMHERQGSETGRWVLLTVHSASRGKFS